jgi:hypothetical protein
MASTDVPKQDTKGVNVNTVVIATGKQLWCHVDRRTNNAPTHHGLWFAKTQVGDFSSVSFVQLK